MPDAQIDPAWLDPLIVPEAERREDWWRAFGDPVLDALVARALVTNPDLQTAAVRILQAQAQTRVAASPRSPQLGANGGLNAFRIPPELADRLQGIDPLIFQDTATLQASWELDLWGKNRSAARGAAYDALSAGASYDAALVSLLGNIASSYIELRVRQARLETAEATLATQRRSAVLAEVRHREGSSTGQDPAQATTAAGQAQSQVATLQGQVKEQRHALAWLVGITDAQLSPLVAKVAPIPPVPTPSDAGIPRDLLRNRPDVQQAELTAFAEFQRLKSAKASLYPSFSLAGAIGLSATTIGSSMLLDIFNWDKRTVSGGLSFAVPLFDHGKLVSQVRVQDAKVEAALIAYEKAVLSAQREVTDALAQCEAARLATTALDAAGQASARSLRIASVRYREGAGDHQSLLTAEASDLSVRDLEVQARGNAAQAYVALNRALGAGPKTPGLPPRLSPAVSERMRARSRWGRLLPATQAATLTIDPEPRP